MANTDSFVFYRSFYEAIKELLDDERLAVFDAICAYGLDHEDNTETAISKGMMALIRPQLDANYRKRQNGSQGGRPKTAQSSEELEDKADNQGTNRNLDETKTKPKGNQSITKTKPNNNQSITKGEPNVNVNVNANVNANENVNVNGRFIKPTLDDVIAYCRERRNGVDPQKWFDYYSANGWKVGKNPMKDWKACVRTWERNNPKPQEEPARRYEQPW